MQCRCFLQLHIAQVATVQYMFRLHFNIHNAIFFQTISSELNLEPSIQQLIVANCQRQYKYLFSFLICIECLLLDLTWLTIIEYPCHKWPRLCFNCRMQFPVLYSFMTYHWVCNYINRTGATSGTGTAYPSRTLEFLVGFVLLEL